jgi:autotransporter-associated beta strand protein
MSCPARKPRPIALALLAYGLLACGPALGQNTWNGSAGTTNWSTPGNWSFGIAPGVADTVVFDNTAPAPSAVVDNIVDSNFTISSLTYSAQSTVGYHTTLINPGLSLNLNGTGGNALMVGTGTELSAADSIYWRVLGGGTLTVTNSTGAIYVVQVGSAADHYATLDLSGLTNFSASLDQLLVGAFTFATGLNRPMGIMRLADANYLQTSVGTTKPGILVASYPGSDTNVRGTQQLFLGGNNIINSDVISVGGHKSTGQILFRTGLTGGSAVIRGSAGGTDRVKLITIGDPKARIADLTGSGTSTASTGTFDTTGNSLDLSVADMIVGRGQGSGTGTGNSTGTATFDTGTIDANNLYIGYHETGTTTAANATGTMNVNGTATLTVNNDVVMARKVGTSIPVATLNVASNGTVNVKGNVVTSGGTSTINLNGGMINLQPAGDATPGYVSVSTLAGSGTITNAANVTNTLALTPGGSASAGTLAVGGSLTLAANAAFNVNLTNATTIGGGVNDYVSVTGNLNLNSNALVVIPLANTAAAGSYRLIDYTGTRSGFLNLTNPTRYNLALDYPANQVNLTVSGSAGNVRWNSASSTAWDIATSNWFNTGSSAPDRFLQLDSVLVDDSGSYTNLLLLNTVLYPNNVTVSSSTRDYFFGGSSRFSGAASLTKSGTSMLTISNANDFTGPVLVNGGILRVINNTALGATNGSTTVASGGTLDIFGSSLYSPGELITIAGTGLNNTGAVINTGAAQNNGIRYLTLSDNATIRGDNRFDVRGPSGSGSFSGTLDLNGFTLTKLGAAQQSLADVVATNAGSIVIGGGTLGLTRSIVDGPGYINVLTNILLFENSSTGYVNKAISVAGGIIRATGNALTVNAPITNLAPGAVIDNSVQLTLTNIITGAGSLTKSSAGTLVLLAPDTCTGPTTISAGRLTVSTNSSLALSPSIAVAANAVLDVAAVSGGFVLGGSQTLSGSGAVVGDVSANAGANLVPGTSPGTLTFSNNLTLNSVTNVIELGSDPTQVGNNANDLIAVSSNLTLNGVTTLRIQPIGPLSGALPYTVMTYSNTLTGGLANLQVTSTNPRYFFSVVDPVSTPGSIQVSVSGVPTTLVWRGGTAGNPNAWDATTSNWLNGASSDTFFSGDSVQFDDTATTNLVSIVGTELPGLVAVNNSSLAYTLAGAGGLSAGSLIKQNSGALVIGNGTNNAFSAGMTISDGPVSFANNGVNTFGLAGPVTLNSGSLLFSNPSNNLFGGVVINGGTLTFNQQLNGTVSTAISNTTPSVAGTLVQASPTILTLSGNNTNFDGPIVVSGGILKAANANALGNNSGATTVANGATLDINGTSLYNPGDDIIISGFGLSNTGAVINTGAAQQNAIRSLILSNNASIAAWGNRWDIRGPGGSGSFSGNLNLNGFTLTKLGSGQNSIVDANVLNAGVIDVVGGTLTVTRSSVPAAGYVNLSSNALVLENYSLGNFSMPVTVNGGIIRLTGTPAFSFDSVITDLAGGLTFDNNTTLNLTGAGTISGTGPLAKTGTGPVVLTAVDSTWGGSTTIAGGTLQIGSGGNDGSLPDLPITDNGTLTFNFLNNITNTQPITGTGALQQIAGGEVFLGGSISINGAITLTAGTMYLTASNSYLGTTTLNSTSGGTLVIANSYALGATNGNTTINGNTGANSTLELAGNNMIVPEAFSLSARQTVAVDVPHIRNASGTNTLTGQITGTTGGNAYNIQSDSGLLTVAGNFVPPSTAGTRNLKLLGDGNGVWSGIISNSVDTLVPAVLNKLGLGTWTLSGSNIYFGSTIIGAGTLALGSTGSINSTPSIDVQSSATFNVAAVSGGYVLGANQTLKGNGTVIGNVAANGTVAPGESIGALTFSSSLVLSGTTIMEIDRLNAPYADLIVANAVTYGGTLVVTNLGDPLQFGDTFTLFSAATRSGSFSLFSLPPLPDPSLAWDTSRLAADGTIKVVVGISTTPTNIQWSVSGGNLTLSWPSDHLGWTLLVQTNNLDVGISTNQADWGPVPGSASVNQIVIPLDVSKRTEFYRLAYPYP